MIVNGDFHLNVARLRRRSRLVASVHLVFLIAVIAGMAVTCVEAGAQFRQQRAAGPGALLFVAGAIAVGAIWHLMRAASVYVAARPRVVPYFKDKYFKSNDITRKTSDESQAAFTSGYSLAYELSALDVLACQLDVVPLSNFGFGDDFLKQRPQWSELEEGIRTVAALVDRLLDGRQLVSAGVLSELQTLLAALTKARETQSSFALIVRYGHDHFISGAEMNQREGTFWC